MIQNIRNLANEIVATSKYVAINNDAINKFTPPEINRKQKVTTIDFRDPTTKLNIYRTLFDCAIQFCFWYGTANIRPNNASSSTVTKIVNDYLIYTTKWPPPESRFDIQQMISQLKKSGMTMIPERVAIWQNIVECELHPTAIYHTHPIISALKKKTVEETIECLVTHYTCFCGDMFLKRAFLFCRVLDSMYPNLFTDKQNMIVPADYQIPKVLYSLDILNYNDELTTDIANDVIIPKHSRKEVEIRANTIIAIDKLRDKTGLSVSELDDYLFNMRNQFTTKHHLTYTTDY